MKNLLVVLAGAALVAALAMVAGCPKGPETAVVADDSPVLASAGEVKVTLAEIRAELEHKDKAVREEILKSPESLQEYLNNALLARQVVALARTANLHTDTEHQFQLRQAENGVLFSRYKRYWAEQNIPVSDTEIAQFYAEKHDEFSHGDLLEMSAWAAPDKATAEQARAVLVGGGSIAQAVRQFGLEELGERQLPPIIPLDKVRNDDFFKQHILPLRDGQFSQVIPAGNAFLIFHRRNTIAAKTFTLDEVRAEIATILRSRQFDAAFGTFTDGLRTQQQPVFETSLYAELGVAPAATPAVPAMSPAAPATAPAAPVAPAVPATPAAAPPAAPVQQ